MSRLHAYLYLLVAAAILVGVVGVLSQKSFSLIPGVFNDSAQDSEADTPIPQPPFTEGVKAQLAVSNGFQFLISYTDRGFEPRDLSLQSGETVRFTNNSHHDLWVASGEGQRYPAARESCGASALDSCRALHPGEFWEFTFDFPGTWSYLNNLDKSDAGVARVQ